MNKLGKIIVLEGADGCGKSTQTELLKKHLEQEGYSVFKWAFPSHNNIIGSTTRRIISSDEFNEHRVEDLQRLFLYEQIDFFRSLSQVKHYYDYIIIDRSYLSTIIYSMSMGVSDDFINDIKHIINNEIPKFDYMFILGKAYVRQSLEKKPEDKLEELKDVQLKTIELYYNEKFVSDIVNANVLTILEGKTKQNNLQKMINVIKGE